MGAIARLQFVAKVLDVAFHGVRRQKQLGADLQVGVALRHQGEHLGLALGDGPQRGVVGMDLPEQIGQAGIDVDPAAAHRADRRAQRAEPDA